MSRMVIRPPAARFQLVATGRQGVLTAHAGDPTGRQTPLGDRAVPGRNLARQSFGAVAQPKSYGDELRGGAQGGAPDFRQGARRIRYVIQDILQINPAHEQPRLDYVSGRQPFIRWQPLRRWSRTFMSASPRFQGRWAYVGYMQRQYAERARMTGVVTRQGTSYAYPRSKTTPRTIQLRGTASIPAQGGGR